MKEERNKYIYLTAKDLLDESRNKSFEDITIKDFKQYESLLKYRSNHIFFIDDRHKYSWWNKLLGIANYVGNRVKIIL